MIVYPKEWNEVGKPISMAELEKLIKLVVSEIDCNCLALSGGLDSSLMLYYMSEVHDHVKAFTVGLSAKHPDIKYARMIVKGFENVDHTVLIPTRQAIANERLTRDRPGDAAVRLFYKFVSRYTDRIVSCDGVDEYMCGYYDHQKCPNEDMYYRYLGRLQQEHLEPLNRNSGSVKVFLPYLDKRLINLFAQIPIADKVDLNSRKKIMVHLAKGNVPESVITRRKYGFCDAMKIK